MPTNPAVFFAARFVAQDAASARSTWLSAYYAALVLGVLESPAKPGKWQAGDAYPLLFVDMCAERKRDVKGVARDAKALAYYLDLIRWCADAPAHLASAIHELHPGKLRRMGLHLGHFREMREIAKRYEWHPLKQLQELHVAVVTDCGAAAMRKHIERAEEAESGKVYTNADIARGLLRWVERLNGVHDAELAAWIRQGTPILARLERAE